MMMLHEQTRTNAMFACHAVQVSIDDDGLMMMNTLFHKPSISPEFAWVCLFIGCLDVARTISNDMLIAMFVWISW